MRRPASKARGYDIDWTSHFLVNLRHRKAASFNTKSNRLPRIENYKITNDNYSYRRFGAVRVSMSI